jgi:tRNA-specific 2-thiouridylase
MGLTPNPCVLCNRTFKFAHLLSLAKQLNCDRIATGHYARIARRRDQNGQLVFALLEAEDRGKDQSYFLYRLTQRELSRSLFPLGRLLKSQVYTLAKRFSVPLDHRSYRESQDLCFFPEKSPDAFLRRYITNAKPGPIKLLDGTVIGQHKGLPFSTIGQRRGLPISGQRRPLYVVRKEQKSCTIFMAPARAGREKVASVTSLSFTHRPPPEKRSVRFSARIRSRSPKMRGAFVRRGRTGRFTFDRAVSHLTPGQSLVLYRGREIVGGGIVALSSPLRFH